MKNRSDKGFSLVELIVVIAIMAVLVGSLAPAYLKYVEKTRMQKDDTAAGEILHAAEIVVLSGDFTVQQTTLVKFSSDGVEVVEPAVADKLENYLIELFGDLSEIKPCSNTYQDMVYEIQVEPIGDITKDSVIKGEWKEK